MERRMENRLGERVSIQLAVRLVATRPRTIGIGLLKNLSRSGALIVNCDLPLYSLIQVVFKSRPGLNQDDESVAAYVTRVGDDGSGVEWCEFAPPGVAEMLQTVIASSEPLAERPADSQQLANYAS
jgi:hypothetical protein